MILSGITLYSIGQASVYWTASLRLKYRRDKSKRAKTCVYHKRARFGRFEPFTAPVRTSPTNEMHLGLVDLMDEQLREYQGHLSPEI
jgi:hypothetical protein